MCPGCSFAALCTAGDANTAGRRCMDCFLIGGLPSGQRSRLWYKRRTLNKADPRWLAIRVSPLCGSPELLQPVDCLNPEAPAGTQGEQLPAARATQLHGPPRRHARRLRRRAPRSVLTTNSWCPRHHAFQPRSSRERCLHSWLFWAPPGSLAPRPRRVASRRSWRTKLLNLALYPEAPSCITTATEAGVPEEVLWLQSGHAGGSSSRRYVNLSDPALLFQTWAAFRL